MKLLMTDENQANFCLVITVLPVYQLMQLELLAFILQGKGNGMGWGFFCSKQRLILILRNCEIIQIIFRRKCLSVDISD